MITSGSALLAETAPRSDIDQLSSPGAEDARVMITPGTWPCRACTGLVSAPFSWSISSLTTATEPERDSFFTVP